MNKTKIPAEQPHRVKSQESWDKTSLISTGRTLDNSIYVKEYLQLVVFFLFLFASLSAASFDPNDSSSFAIRSGDNNLPYSNLFGKIGAGFAEYGYQFFGVGLLLFCLVFLIQTLATFQRVRPRSRWHLRLLGYPQLIVCFLGLIASVKPQWMMHGFSIATGGWIGSAISRELQQWMGPTGAKILLIFGFISSLPLCLGIRPLSLVRYLVPSKWADWSVEDNVQARTVAIANAGVNAASSATFEFKAAGNRAKPLPEILKDIDVMAVERGVAPALPLLLPVAHDVREDSFAGFISLLSLPAKTDKDTKQEDERLLAESVLLEEKLATFGVRGTTLRSQPGPVVNVHEFEPAPGIKVTRVLSLQDDLALGLKAQSIMMAPQSGKSTIGIEIPAQRREIVSLREVMESAQIHKSAAFLPMALGKLVDGSALIADLATMPHLLVAGSTGSGKSVGINTIILSMLMTRTPEELRLILVDPKMLELSNYDGIGHLLMPVVTDPAKAAGALKWVLQEMDRRYKLMKKAQVRNISGFNQFIKGIANPETDQVTLPYIVVVIDELCDLMMTAPKDVEDCIQRISQMARASGIHLVLATQRPSVDVLTGVIKANLPCRISFQVASKHDSRTIIETVGAERLLGKGDMLYLPPGTGKLVRAHGAYVIDAEINAVADLLRQKFPTKYDALIMSEIDRASQSLQQNSKSSKADMSLQDSKDEDELYDLVIEFATDSGSVSTSSIQRHFRIGYNKAARLMDRMVQDGLVGPSDVAGKPRQVLAPSSRA